MLPKAKILSSSTNEWLVSSRKQTRDSTKDWIDST